MGHTIYWVDSKLNTIESMNEDGERRNIVARGTHLNRPLSIDVFESMMYWASSGSGDKGGAVMEMDKFGRGVTQTIASNLQHTASVKVFHPSRYNTSLSNPCVKTQCTHLCLIIPTGYRCKCPNNQAFQQGSKTSCDAAYEEPKPQPLVCKCQNGGFCVETKSGETQCECEENYKGEHCDVSIHLIVISNAGGRAAIVVPILLIIMVIVCAISLYVYYQRKRGEPKVLGGITNSVSFRQGTNVEFDGPSFVEGGNGLPVPQKGVETTPMADNRDFSNPMYGLRSVPAIPTESPEAAVLAPSVVTHQTPPQQVRHRELNPASIDTGKDTQCLVAEDDSEC
jgi:low density lipoprotein-related protein 2